MCRTLSLFRGAGEEEHENQMTPARWQEVKGVIGEAMEIDQTQERAQFIAQTCADDTALRREVESLISTSASRLEGAVDDLRQSMPDISDVFIGRRLGAYRIVRELGRGGMGAVYLAARADEEFEKDVAIKLLKRGTDTDEVLLRFRSERKILARLEHPNIARLLDAGTTEDGLPYFVMEYIAGTRLDVYCRERELSVAERLQLFLKICRAVRFAHQNLVIHRDLKPANILITAEGEPKLLDFGIAKLLEVEASGFEQTIPDQQRLTPAYASPEQVSGAAVTTVSDVYSLGALLYELLVGRPAHQFSGHRPSPTELWSVIVENPPARPSVAASDAQIARSLRGDLDNILLTALRKESARRYPGVGALAEDIERHLEKRPVQARRATVSYKAAKFLQRNKALAVGVALAAVMLLAGTTVSLWQAWRARQEARRAERNFQDVRHLANSFLFEFHDAIASLPGATETRKLIVGRALEYLDKLTRESGGRRELQLELAEAYLKIGDVQGKPYTANLGDSNGALRSYGKAAEIASAWADRETKTAETGARNQLARACLALAAVEARLNRLQDATDHNRRALLLGQELLRDAPIQGHEWRRLLVTAHLGLGDAIQAGNHQRRDPALHRASLEQYQRALPMAEQLAAAHPDSTEDIRRLAKSCSRAALVGELGAATGEDHYFDEALALQSRATQLNDQLLQRDPRDAVVRRLVADGLIMKAGTHVLARRDLESAQEGCERALAIQEELAAADSSNIEAQQDLAYAHYMSGRVAHLRDDLAMAARNYQAALRILEPLVRQYPENIETAFDLERARRGLAELAP